MLGDFFFVNGDLDNALSEYADLYKEHPKDIQVKKNYIELLILKDEDPEARQLDDEILKSDPNDNEGLIYRGQLQLRGGDAKSATGTLQTAVKNNPNDAVAHYHLGAAYERLGNLNGAESEWQESLRLRPGQDEVVRALAELAMRRGNTQLLEQTATQMISLEPSSPEGYSLRATAEINEKKFDNAENDARKAIGVAPQSAFGYVQMGNLKLAQKDYKDAARYFQQALDRNSDSVDALRGLMNTLFVKKQFDVAVSSVRNQIAKSPKNSEFYDLLGVALSRNKGNLNEAEAAFSKALELDANNYDAIINLGETETANGDIEKAITLFENSVKDHPQQSPFYIFLGRLYEAQHDWKKAESTYQRALVVKPDDALAANNLAKVLIAEGGNYDTALSLAQTARQSLPDSPVVADTLGWIYYQKGAYTSAVGLLEESVKLREKNNFPDNADVHYHLGLAYAKTDQRRLAREQLERVLKIDPNYGAAADVKKELALLRS
jgi:Flp pilus assembly protein TadD